MSGYDERLLAAAPAISRSDKQEGYNIDLLEGGATIPGSSPKPTASLPSHHGHAEAAIASKEVLESYPRLETPWWRTKKWIIVFVVLAVIAVAAIVGGAVGGTAHHHNDVKIPNNGTNATSSGSDSSPVSQSVTSSLSIVIGGGPSPSPSIATTGSDQGAGLGSVTPTSNSSDGHLDLSAPTLTAGLAVEL